jgi:hypothetical protein
LEKSLSELRAELNKLHEETAAEIRTSAKSEMISATEQNAEKIRGILESNKLQELEFEKRIEAENLAFVKQKEELQVSFLFGLLHRKK